MTRTKTKMHWTKNPERVAELRALLINALKNREEQYTDGHTLFVGKNAPDRIAEHRGVMKQLQFLINPQPDFAICAATIAFIGMSSKTVALPKIA